MANSSFAVDAHKFARRLIEPIAYATDGSFVKPSNLSLSLTNRCNLRCPTCSFWQTPASEKANELTAGEMERLLVQLKEWLGVYQISLTGGEPMLRNEFFDVLRSASRLGIRLATVCNGSLLPPRRVEALREILDQPNNPMDTIGISLNDLDTAAHDRTRGVEGSAEKIFQAIELLNYPERRFRLTLSTIIMPYNIERLPALAEWVKEKGLDGITFQIYYFQSGNDKYSPGWFREDQFWEDNPEKIDRGIDRLIELRSQGYPIVNLPEHLEYIRCYLKGAEERIDLPCRVGVANMDIEPNGDVRLCDVMEPIGNIRHNHPREIWSNGIARQRRWEIRTCKAACRIKSCNFRKPLTSVVKERMGML